METLVNESTVYPMYLLKWFILLEKTYGPFKKTDTNKVPSQQKKYINIKIMYIRPQETQNSTHYGASIQPTVVQILELPHVQKKAQCQMHGKDVFMEFAIRATEDER